MTHAAAEIDTAAGLDFVRSAGIFISPTNPSHPGIGAELQQGAGHGAFDDCGIVRISNEAVGDGSQHRIGGSSGRDTEMLMTPSSVILDGAEGTRLDDLDAIGRGFGVWKMEFGFS